MRWALWGFQIGLGISMVIMYHHTGKEYFGILAGFIFGTVSAEIGLHRKDKDKS